MGKIARVLEIAFLLFLATVFEVAILTNLCLTAFIRGDFTLSFSPYKKVSEDNGPPNDIPMVQIIPSSCLGHFHNDLSNRLTLQRDHLLFACVSYHPQQLSVGEPWGESVSIVQGNKWGQF